MYIVQYIFVVVFLIDIMKRHCDQVVCGSCLIYGMQILHCLAAITASHNPCNSINDINEPHKIYYSNTQTQNLSCVILGWLIHKLFWHNPLFHGHNLLTYEVPQDRVTGI